jgi:glycosyltransferase involved in cell wall biosynthesis
MEVRDLWPESIKTVGMMKNNLWIRYFEQEERWCYQSARKIVVVTDSFKEVLINRGVPADKIAVVKNGVNASLFVPQKKDEQLIESLGLKGKRIIGYIGTHGMAHRLDFILHCAKNLQQTDYHFLFVGSGAEKEKLLNLKENLQLSNVTMLDSVSKHDVVRYISILDVALIHLKKSPLFKTVIPSKIFENASMEIPILLGVEGEAKKIIEHYGAGLCFEPENEIDFQVCLSALLQDENFYTKCQRGCRKLAFDFDRKKLAHNMLNILETTIHSVTIGGLN